MNEEHSDFTIAYCIHLHDQRCLANLENVPRSISTVRQVLTQHERNVAQCGLLPSCFVLHVLYYDFLHRTYTFVSPLQETVPTKFKATEFGAGSVSASCRNERNKSAAVEVEGNHWYRAWKRKENKMERRWNEKEVVCRDDRRLNVIKACKLDESEIKRNR